MFCVDLRENSDYFPVQHQLTGLYNRKCVYCAVRAEPLTIIPVNLNPVLIQHWIVVAQVEIFNQDGKLVNVSATSVTLYGVCY